MATGADAESGLYSRDEIMLATIQARDAQIAEFLTVAIGIAAERHPEELQKALGKVFNTKAIETSLRRQMTILEKIQKATADAKGHLVWIEDQLSEAAKELDQLRKRKT